MSNFGPGRPPLAKNYDGLKKAYHERRAFNWYFKKMNDEHRNDKKDVIAMLLKARPESATFRDRTGSLPIHLALVHGQNWFDESKQSWKSIPKRWV